MTLIFTCEVWFHDLNAFNYAQNRIESGQQRDV